MLKMVCVNYVFVELDQNLQKSYFNELFPMYAKQMPVEYSPCGVL